MNDKLTLREQIQQLSRDNAIVRSGLSAYHLGHMSYEEALSRMVLALADENAHLLKVATHRLETSAVPMWRIDESAT